MVIGAIILFVISALAFVMSVRSFLNKGFLFNNAYIYASEQQRKEMDKKPHYRQSGIIFIMIGLIFFINGLDLLINAEWLLYIVIVISIITVIYAIASTVIIEKSNKK